MILVMIFFLSTLGFRNNMSNLLKGFPQLIATIAELDSFLTLHEDVFTLIVFIAPKSSFWFDILSHRTLSRLLGDKVRILFWWLLFLNRFSKGNEWHLPNESLNFISLKYDVCCCSFLAFVRFCCDRFPFFDLHNISCLLILGS